MINFRCKGKRIFLYFQICNEEISNFNRVLTIIMVFLTNLYKKKKNLLRLGGYTHFFYLCGKNDKG